MTGIPHCGLCGEPRTMALPNGGIAGRRCRCQRESAKQDKAEQRAANVVISPQAKG